MVGVFDEPCTANGSKLNWTSMRTDGACRVVLKKSRYQLSARASPDDDTYSVPNSVIAIGSAGASACRRRIIGSRSTLADGEDPPPLYASKPIQSMYSEPG